MLFTASIFVPENKVGVPRINQRIPNDPDPGCSTDVQFPVTRNQPHFYSSRPFVLGIWNQVIDESSLGGESDVGPSGYSSWLRARQSYWWMNNRINNTSFSNAERSAGYQKQSEFMNKTSPKGTLSTRNDTPTLRGGPLSNGIWSIFFSRNDSNFAPFVPPLHQQNYTRWIHMRQRPHRFTD